MFPLSDPLTVHRPDLIRARCVNETEPPYGYYPKPESRSSAGSSVLLSPTGATSQSKGLYDYTYKSSSTSVLGPTGTEPKHSPTSYPSSSIGTKFNNSVLIGATGSSTRSHGSHHYIHESSGTSVIADPTGTGLRYASTTSFHSGYRNSSSSSALISATGSSNSAVISPVGTGSSFSSTYPTGGFTHSQFPTVTGLAGSTGTSSSYSSFANTSSRYPYSTASTGTFASSVNIKPSLSAIYPTTNATASPADITVGPSVATSSVSSSSTAALGRCPHDNVLRALLRHFRSASLFCPRYLQISVSDEPLIPLPAYLSAFPTSRVSTACSCFTVGLAGLNTTIRATSTFITTLTTSGSAYDTSTNVLASPVGTTVANSTLPVPVQTATDTYEIETGILTDTYVPNPTTSTIGRLVSTSSSFTSSYGTGLSGYGYGHDSSLPANVSTVTIIKTSGSVTEFATNTSVSRSSTGSVVGSPVMASGSSSAVSDGMAFPSYGFASGSGRSMTAGPTHASSSSASASASVSVSAFQFGSLAKLSPICVSFIPDQKEWMHREANVVQLSRPPPSTATPQSLTPRPLIVHPHMAITTSSRPIPLLYLVRQNKNEMSMQ